ncbi:adenylosuccinate lyase [Candidatus Peregrinibacteria bacterium]|nr:adenylosuccinate lyase [Candidatus Peregrinibacteria bacterium]
MFDSDPILSISPLTGRYQEKLLSLQNYFSEMALMRYRIAVEVEWIIHLCNTLKLAETQILEKKEINFLKSLYIDFTLDDAHRIKEIEQETNHDVKAVEYFIREKIEHSKWSKLKKLESFIHFACTSEDINNMAYGLSIKDFLDDEYIPLIEMLMSQLSLMSKKYKSIAMLGHTHGQSAVSTTVGKELWNFCYRIEQQLQKLKKIEIFGKFNGAVGNYNAHVVAYPEIDWLKTTRDFIEQFGLTQNPITTQIEPHDNLAEIFDIIRRLNTIILDFNRDMWTYISMGYFKQKTKKGEVGSSTMPHKVNPIDFENSEGNLGIANALLSHFSEKLPVSRLQRDLSDSTVLRNIGSAFGYSALAYLSVIRGLKKVEVNEEKIDSELEKNYAMLAEAIQTILRKQGKKDAYERLKEFSRGKKVTKDSMQNFIKSLKLEAKDEKMLLNLTPKSYIGLAEKLTKF